VPISTSALRHLGAHPAPDRWRPGGNLDKIGYVIRERFRILGQVKALTAEGRLSGIILIACPSACSCS